MDISHARTFLQRHGWLAAASPDLAAEILKVGHFRTFASGDTICEGGTLSGSMCGIARGQVGIRWYAGNFDSDIAHIGVPGSWWGGGPAWGTPREGHVRARTEVDAILIDVRELRELASTIPSGWRDLGLLALDTAHIFAAAHDDLMVRDIRRRCLYVLLRLSGHRRKQLFPLPPEPILLSQDELGQMANLSRSVVNRILRELRDRGLIEAHYRSIRLTNPEGLAKLAETD